MDLSAFAKIAPYLANPLTLAGFLVFLFFAIHRLLIKSGIIPPVSKTQAPAIVKLFLSYGFAVAVLIIIAGFGLQAYQSHLEAAGPSAIQQETQGAVSPAVANTKGNVTITVTQPPAPSSEKKP
jgi:predicted PurR-regulated permease PerM